MRYKLIKLTRRIRILLGGFKSMEEKHKLFQRWKPEEGKFRIDVEWIASRLRDHGYYYNVASTTYRKQIYTARKLIDHDHQIHLRFYSDGWVSGHYELQPVHPLEHLDGVELRALTKEESETIWNILLPSDMETMHAIDLACSYPERSYAHRSTY